jgi:hypothetical protein
MVFNATFNNISGTTKKVTCIWDTGNDVFVVLCTCTKKVTCIWDTGNDVFVVLCTCTKKVTKNLIKNFKIHTFLKRI